MPPVLDHIFEFVGRYVVSSRSKTRFFHEGWGDLALARDVSRRSRAYFALDGPDDEWVESARAQRARGVDIRWTAATTAESGYGNNILRQDAAFESPFADALPEESRLVRFARLRPDAAAATTAATTAGRAAEDGASTSRAIRRIAVLLPCTGDVDEWFRRSIARDLLADGVECVIPTIAYYGARKPEAQWRHVLRSVAEAKIQLSVTPVEMMLLSRALMREAEREGFVVELCLAGVSLGGTMSASTACALASARAARGDEASTSSAVGVCCIAAGADCTPYVDGSIETRLAWDVLRETLDDDDGDDDDERPASKARARDALLRVMEDLDVDRLLVESSVRAAVCLTARDDRFIGAKSNEKVAAALRRMTTDASKFHREDVDGGHLQFLFGSKRVIAPSISRAFDLIRR